MQLGMIGLGRMGGNIVRRLMRAGHSCVVYDADPKAVATIAAEGATPATSLADLVEKLDQRPRAAWVMLPAGKITEETVNTVAGLMSSRRRASATWMWAPPAAYGGLSAAIA